jgi:hypothetical protein
MTDREWLTALLDALDGVDWMVECAGIMPHYPYASAALHHRLTNECRVVHFPLRAVRDSTAMKTEILRQLM